MPSPKFSSAIEDVSADDDERAEIVKCILSNDHKNLKSVLENTKIDITKMKDEMSYTLLHLSSYNNSEQCLKLLISHILSSDPTSTNPGQKNRSPQR